VRSVLAALVALTPLAALAEIEVHDAWAYAATPNAPAGAVYMVIHNHGGPDDRLIAVRSDAAARIVLHATVENADGTMGMVALDDGVPLPDGGEILLEQGGDHIMLMGLTAPWPDGHVIELTLEFSVSGPITVSVPVDRARLGDALHDH
jgi:periplasmic copper chaperone A